MTYTEAFERYLESGLEDIMPFDSKIEHSFLQMLKNQGIEIDEEED